MKKSIEITDNTTEEKVSYDTNGYILLYLSDNSLKVTGDLELKALAPLLLKFLAEKMTTK